jgi:hypothetical protein
VGDTDAAGLRIELGKFYRVTLDLLSEMPGVFAELGLTRLPHYTAFRDWFARILVATWRAFLTASVKAESGHAAVDSTGTSPATTAPAAPTTTSAR